MSIPPMRMEYANLHQELQQTDNQDRARAYKSRNKRPCDFCRYKKAACHLDSAPPCELCSRYNKECTFVESPAKRRRPNDEQRIQDIPPPFEPMGGFDMNTELLHWEQPPGPFFPGIPQNLGFNPVVPFEPLVFEQFDPVNAGLAPPTATPQSLPLENGNSEEPSLDNQASSNAQLVGVSGECDPYLLRQYKYDSNNECSFQQLRIRRVGDNRGIPVHFMIQQNKLANKAQPIESSEGSDTWRKDVKEMVTDEVGKRLLSLFFQYVQPYFPIMSRDQFTRDGEFDPERIQTCVLAAMYGHAVPFCIFDAQLCVEVYTPSSADALFKIAYHAAMSRCHTPSLSVVQTMLLMVQRRPTNRHVADTPMKGVMMATCVHIAQTLGLNLDPSNWPLPLWEIRLRRRLAWAVYSQEKWLSLNAGRHSLINCEEWDLERLGYEDFEESEEDLKHPSPEHFLRLCSLSEIVDDILVKLFSIMASRRLCDSLETTLEVAKPLRIRLTQWYQNLPAELSIKSKPHKADALNGHGSLHLAYITSKLELFRAMLRPRIMDPTGQAGSALRKGAISVARELLDFLEALDSSYLEAFWASYSRTNFTIASNFMLLLFATAPSVADAKECFQLLTLWRSLLRIKSCSCDLLNLALLRLDGTYVAGMDQLIDLSPAALQVFQETTY